MVLFSFFGEEEVLWKCEENGQLGEMFKGDYGGFLGDEATVFLFIKGDFDRK